MRRFSLDLMKWLLLCAVLSGCDDPPSQTPSVSTTTGPAAATYLLTEEPSDAMDVIPLRESASDGDPVVVVGRIGGSEDPWVANRAAFSIVDRSLAACSDREGDDCPIPWDYCCETDRLPKAKVLIKLVDADGELVNQAARAWLNLRELQTVVVRGVARRDDAGNLTIASDGLYVRPVGDR